MKTWRCVFSDGLEYLILAMDRASALVNATELYGSCPVNVFVEGDW